MSTLPNKAKVVIIGGGIHGLSTAWKLSETYKNPGDIVVLEKKRYSCRSKWNCLRSR
jgi:glycine/D-amino acid oxidase-like deaminating enzyme